jgi:hypothetical protein
MDFIVASLLDALTCLIHPRVITGDRHEPDEVCLQLPLVGLLSRRVDIVGGECKVRIPGTICPRVKSE